MKRTESHGCCPDRNYTNTSYWACHGCCPLGSTHTQSDPRRYGGDTVLIFSRELRNFSSNPFHLPQKPTPYRLSHAKQPYFQLTPAPRRSAPLRSKRPNARKRPNVAVRRQIVLPSRFPAPRDRNRPVSGAERLSFAIPRIFTDLHRRQPQPLLALTTLEISPRSQTTPREKLTKPNLPDTLKLPHYSPYAKGIVQKVGNRDE